MSESFLNGRVVLHAGDSRDVLKTLADNSIDSIVTDPPYALVSIAKRFATVSENDIRVARANPHRRPSGGFMGKAWDTGETAFAVEFWQQCLRVLKPGGHVVAFSGTRTYHRMACAIEDAGFEIRDQLQWVYGSGFPKSHDVSKGIDRAAGAAGKSSYTGANYKNDVYGNGMGGGITLAPYEAATASALQWQGWGTALKPSCEPICFGRKPLSGTGTTGEAAYREGFKAVLIEREAEYQEDIRRRMALVLSGPDERARESIKARLKDAPVDPGPLFGGLDPIAEAAE